MYTSCILLPIASQPTGVSTPNFGSGMAFFVEVYGTECDMRAIPMLPGLEARSHYSCGFDRGLKLQSSHWVPPGRLKGIMRMISTACLVLWCSVWYYILVRTVQNTQNNVDKHSEFEISEVKGWNEVLWDTGIVPVVCSPHSKSATNCVLARPYWNR